MATESPAKEPCFLRSQRSPAFARYCEGFREGESGPVPQPARLAFSRKAETGIILTAQPTPR